MPTKKTYFTPSNKYLSSSKLKDYMLSPYYFYQKHLLYSIPFSQTPSMRIGSAADAYLTGSKQRFEREYRLAARRNLKEPPEGYTELTPAEYQTALDIIEAVKATDVYKDLKKNAKKQVLLSIKKKIGIFPGLAGILDWLKISELGTKAVISDLKTTSDIANLKLGYYFQQAVYQTLVMNNYPKVQSCISYILAVENSLPYRVALYQLDQDKIDMEIDKLNSLLDEISTMKRSDFSKRPNIGWEDRIII